MRLVPMLVIGCPQCGVVDGHKPNCPVPKLEALEQKQKWIACPVCGNFAVDVNGEDLWECRHCRSQFVNGTQESPPIVRTTGKGFIIIDLVADCAYPVLLLRRKGRGGFPIDRAIRKLQRQLK